MLSVGYDVGLVVGFDVGAGVFDGGGGMPCIWQQAYIKLILGTQSFISCVLGPAYQ